MLSCPLCLSVSSQSIKENLLRCLNCDLVFKINIISNDKEKKRYETHNNNIEDEAYLNYLNKLLTKVEECRDLKSNLKILDFGSGPTQGLKALVKRECLDIEVTSYDPYFYKLDLSKLKQAFDIVFASECFEHFNKPSKTIDEILNVLKVGGLLAVGTYFHDEQTDFSSWWYLRDPTHIVFYSLKTMAYIKSKYDLESFTESKTHSIFRKLS